MFRTHGISAILIALTTFGHGELAAQNPLERGIAEFTAAYEAWDGARFAAACDILRHAATSAPPAFINYYWLGVAEFHRMLQIENRPDRKVDRHAADQAREAAINALNTALKIDSRHAESHALVGTLYGMKIDGNILKAIRYGPTVEKHRKAAVALGAKNPRVQYLLGVCKLHTAKNQAALRSALDTLLEAVRLFEAEAQTAAGPLEPRWGYATCLTFTGRSYELLDQPHDAEKFYRKAMAAHPADHLAEEGLERVTTQRGRTATK